MAIKDKDIIDLLGLTDTTIQLDLVHDLENIMDNGLDKYMKDLEDERHRQQEFIRLFKECYDELCLFMEKDPKKRIAIECYTCLKGIDLSKQYGRHTKKQ